MTILIVINFKNISDVYYVAFGVKNSYGKDIYLRTNLPAPFNKIDISEDQQMQRTFVLRNKNLVNIHAFDAETGQAINIDDQNFLTLTPNRTRPTSIGKMFYVPEEGKLYAEMFTCICSCAVIKFIYQM